MLQFQELTAAHGDRLRGYYRNCDYRLCEYSLGVKLMWRDYLHPSFAEVTGCLVIRNCIEGEYVFDYPIAGPEADVEGALRAIESWCAATGTPLVLSVVPEDKAQTLCLRYPRCRVISERPWKDYLYRTEELAAFAGRRYSGQRNHVNKFLKTYGNWLFRPIEPADIPQVKAFLDRYASRWDKSAATFHEDIAKTHEVLDTYQAYDLLGGMLLVDGEIVGFSLGEIIGDTLFTHIEKADRDYEGCYQMLVAQFAQQFAHEGVSFINREDDTGDPGLRTSKLSYHPVALLEKYTVTVEEPCSFC